MLIWLTDHSPAAVAFARTYLLHHDGVGNDITGAAKAYTASGLAAVHPGPAIIGVRDERVPDLVGLAQPGVVYTGKKSKIAEHGGNTDADRHVPILVAGAGVTAGHTVTRPVETTQIAPTILRLLGLNPGELAAVRAQHTAVLPGSVR
jgi:hypothetical protein